MRRPRWIMLAVAIAFGLMGVLAARLVGESQTRSVQGVNTAQLWSASLPDLAGAQQPLSQWRGRVVVINFWAPWCPPCRQEIPGFIRLQERYGARGLQFIGIALDDAFSVRQYVDEAGINYPILLGGVEGALLGQAAGNSRGGLPYTLLLDRQGRPVAGLVGAVSERRLEELVQPLL
ncbi:MAG: TlpA family protein disulfide reductase [Thiobacillaceae bacterium]|nr:TlpA family protein disulfide reductase [Thiobacillaceae bacterium]MDW8323707.1 TlpA disulfide reductase family protein [Burkholderiales bacterium]